MRFFFFHREIKLTQWHKIQHCLVVLGNCTFNTHLINDVIVLTLNERASKQDKQDLALGRVLSEY